MELSGRRALITGAAIRVGREIALEVARAGAHVLLHYRTSEDQARRTAGEIEELGAGVTLIRGDLAEPAGVESVADAAADADLLVNSASIFPRTPLEDTTFAQWDEILDVNLRAPFFLARRIGLAMKRRGRGVIVNIADWSAHRPYAGYVPYCVSKAGLIAMNAGLAKSLAPEVRVNAIAPGPVMFGEGMTKEQRQHVLRKTPLGREGSPTDVAKAVRFLVEGSDFITGAVLTVDGGRMIH